MEASRCAWIHIMILIVYASTTVFILLLSALQLFESFGLLNYFFPLLPLLRPLFPVGHPHLPQIIPHIVFPSYSWPFLQSCCIRFPFVYGLSHSFISHSFYMPQPAQSLTVFITQGNYKATCFYYWTIIFRPILYKLSHRMLCTHWDPSVFTSVKYLSQIICLGKVNVRNV